MKRLIVILITIVLVMTLFAQGEGNCMLDLSGEYPMSEKTMLIEIRNTAVNTVKPAVFGANTSWRGGGYGTYLGNGEWDETILEKIRNSGVTSVRFPGGIEGDYFHWYESVGDISQRVAQVDCFSRDYPTYDEVNGIKYVVEFGPDEWFEFSRLTGTALTIQLNAGTGTPQEAADYVRYCLQSGAEIESFAVGNETYHEGVSVPGYSIRKTGDEYVQFYLEFWEALGEETIRELRQRGIPVGCICAYGYLSKKDWNLKGILTELRGKVDFVNIHTAYSPANADGKTSEQVIKCLMASGDYVAQQLKKAVNVINEVAPEVNVAIHEYGPINGGAVTNGVAGGIYLASFFHTVTREEKLTSAAYLPLLNHYDSNVLIGALPKNVLDDGNEAVYWDNVVTFVFKMYSEQIGREVLDCAVMDGETFTSDRVGNIPVMRDVFEGDAAVYYDPETGNGTLFILSKAYDRNTCFEIQLPFDALTVTEVTELWTKNRTVINSYKRPNKVAPVQIETQNDLVITDGKLTVIAKPISLIRIDFHADN